MAQDRSPAGQPGRSALRALSATRAERAQREARLEAAARRQKYWLTAPECEPQREAAAALAVARAALEHGIREALSKESPPRWIAQALQISLLSVHAYRGEG